MNIAVSFFILHLMIPSATFSHHSTQNVASISQKEISRARAIEIARSQVKFKPKSIKAAKGKENGRLVWRVTFRGVPVGKLHPMGEIMIVSLDRFTGEIVSIAQS